MNVLQELWSEYELTVYLVTLTLSLGVLMTKALNSPFKGDE